MRGESHRKRQDEKGKGWAPDSELEKDVELATEGRQIPHSKAKEGLENSSPGKGFGKEKHSSAWRFSPVLSGSISKAGG